MAYDHLAFRSCYNTTSIVASSNHFHRRRKILHIGVGVGGGGLGQVENIYLRGQLFGGC